MLYHGTNIANIDKLKLSYGRFGMAVYLSKDRDYAKMFGKYLVEVDEPDTIPSIRYVELVKFQPDLNIDEEEGLTNLKDYIETDVIEIIYEDNTSEVVSYREIEVCNTCKIERG